MLMMQANLLFRSFERSWTRKAGVYIVSIPSVGGTSDDKEFMMRTVGRTIALGW